MPNRMSAADYRKQFIDPVVNGDAMPDDDFKKVIKDIDNKAKPKKKKRVRLGPSEHDIQTRILERLGYLKNGFFWRENSGQFALEHNGKKRFFRAGIKGIADIMGIYRGFPVAIEVKRPETKKNVSVDQKAFLQRFKECGGIAIVCWDDEQVIYLINEEIKKLDQDIKEVLK